MLTLHDHSFWRVRAVPVALAAGSLLAIVLAGLFRYGYFDTSRTVKVGVDQFVPYVMNDGTGHPKGLAVEMITEAARNAGISIEWVKIDNIDDAIRTRKIDIYPLATLTDQRKREFHTSQAWWENEIALISLEQQPLAAPSDTTGKRIAIRGLPIVKQLAEHLFPKAELVTIPKMENMVGALCTGGIDAFFLDLRLLESQLLKGTSPCGGHPLHVASIPNGSLSLGTLAHPEVSRTADKLYREIAQLSADGTLSEIASRWSIYNPFHSRYLKETLDAQHRAELARYGFAAMILVSILISIQTQRIRKARFQAEESNQKFNAFMGNMPAVAFIKDAQGRYSFLNKAFCALLKKTPEQLIGKSDSELLPAADADQFRNNDRRVLESNHCEELLETVTDHEGVTRTFLSYKFPFQHCLGEQYLGAVAIDVTERLRAEEALKLSQFSIDCSQDTMLWVDDQGLIFNANRAACRDLDYSRDELLGLHISEIDAILDVGSFSASRKRLKRTGTLTIESVHKRKGGMTFPVEIQQNFLEFQGKEYSCYICRDITDRKMAEQELAHQARHDALTGLPNRRLLELRLSEAIESARLQNSSVSVLFVDLDGFKLINDTLGHGVGDQLLKQVAVRLTASLREADILFRMGGDEFTAIVKGLNDQTSISTVANQLLGSLRESFCVQENELSVSASIGVSTFPVDGTDESELLRKADAAMYESKRLGKNRVQFFTPEMGQAAHERLELENQLRRAVDRDEFSLVYQPEFCLESGKIVRHEALLRWKHPSLGTVPPTKFIPIAEETSLIIPIGRWVLSEACRRASEWQSGGGEGVGVAVNVSLLQFHRPDFLETIVEILDATGLEPRLLELELTESVVMNNVDDVRDKVTRLRTLGVSVAVDDFGTGYSSLSYLRQLPIDSLKIDKSFISDITFDPNALSLTSAMISIAHSLKMKVVVEGIETPAQLAAIKRLGCEVGQGYYLGMPSATPLLLKQLVAA